MVANLLISHLEVGIYTPLTNQFFNNKMQQSRSRFGTLLVTSTNLKAYYKNQPTVPTMMFYGSDQSPKSSKKAYWMRFLNQDTAISFGAEKFSKEFNNPVFYMSLEKVKRGYFELTFIPISENPRETSYGEITRKHVHLLEKQIIEKPEYWLWTHKRWKREKPDDVIID
jgi:KDO2-lipid IV(A) lauroyltransferase